jgi:hypothetical protein
MKRSKLLSLFVLSLMSMVWLPVDTHADENDDVYNAQRCLDDLGRTGGDHHQALRCIAGIEGYNSFRANTVKCGGYWAYGGFLWPTFLNYPWMLDQTVDYPLVPVLNHVFDVEVSKNFAWKIQTACSNSELGRYPHLSDWIWLKAVLLEVSPLTDNTLVTNLAGLDDQGKIEEIESALQTVIGDCDAAPSNAIIPLKNTSFCLEAERIKTAPGARLYDRFVYRLRVYG